MNSLNKNKAIHLFCLILCSFFMFGQSTFENQNLENALYLSNVDSDGDGLTDELEITIYFTDPYNPDTDNDFMPDGWEVKYLLNPLDGNDNETDLDLDGLDNVAEYYHFTDPSKADSDGDGFSDSLEINNGSDPNNPLDPLVFKYGLIAAVIVMIIIIVLSIGLLYKQIHGGPSNKRAKKQYKHQISSIDNEIDEAADYMDKQFELWSQNKKK